jgi:thermostable 8-oxoguanine DNA glycosylase
MSQGSPINGFPARNTTFGYMLEQIDNVMGKNTTSNRDQILRKMKRRYTALKTKVTASGRNFTSKLSQIVRTSELAAL